MKKILFKIVLFSGFFVFGCASKKVPLAKLPEELQPKVTKSVVENLLGEFDSEPQKKWVDSVFSTMSFHEKLGQLFMVSAYSNKDSLHVKSVEKLIQENKVGGLIFFQGGPGRQAVLTNRFQSKSKIPLLIGIDAEWGLGMRLDSTYRYPWNMTLGAIRDKKILEKVGSQMGEENKRLGVHFNFAPVVDINTNPKNPIIGFRSFGENKENVTESALAIMKGYQSLGLLATGKHFPGHGDTEIDSHHALPTITFSKERLNDVELYPYKKLFAEGLSSVMVAHLNVPSLEPRENIPSSVSRNIITDLLKNEMGFKGLIFTDALNMKAAANFRSPGEIDLEAFLAGNDILLCPENVPIAIEKLCVAYQDSLISEERLSYSVKKILKYKYKAGLNKYLPIAIPNIYNDLNPLKNDVLQYELYENAITVIKNKDSIIPVNNLESEKIAYVKLGDDINSPFLSTLKKYTNVVEVKDEDIDCLLEELVLYTKVIVGFHKSDKAWKSHAFTDKELFWLSEISRNNVTILDVFTKPYSLIPIQYFDDIEAVIVSYQNSEIAQNISAQLIFGAIESKGKLPVSINGIFKVGDGLTTQKSNRLGFSLPENVGLDSSKLAKIEYFANHAIINKMTPGMQILVARKGKVVYEKSFGYHTYENKTKVDNQTIYDIASLTKIIATLPNVMQLYEQQKINMQTTLGEILPIFKNSDKQDIPFKDLLSHYGRLQAWVPFYKATLDSAKRPLTKYYSKVKNEQFSKQVADSLFMRNDYHDTIMKMIVDSKLLPKKEYKYSDFTFIILKDYLENATGKKLDVLVKEQFYLSLGMNNTSFNPLYNSVEKENIPPTEIDNYFRHQIIQGYVHDMEAAMEGGVGGHAGVFSNAMDIAKMMQLYLQKGSYGGHQYFSEKTFTDFNTCYFCAEGNRRGIGFDKPQIAGAAGPTCGCASLTSFGHTGFTGTMTWADPDEELIYVFLSNRTFPESTVNKLSKENIREDIQKVIYESIIK
jgi:beta-glucosidase-like glycosyl hydrolase/CubicO group peptidase (beta-lactamase class C family)